MRLWNLNKLAMKNKLVIHICEKCGWRTPIPPILTLLPIDKEENINNYFESQVEIKNNYCDKCNQEFWKKIKKSPKETP